MNPSTRPEFLAKYWVESFEPLAKVAEIIAGEQSSGTFLQLAGETDELKERARARVVSVKLQEPAAVPSLQSEHLARKPHRGDFHRGEIVVAFPIGNVGPNLSTLLATVAGGSYPWREQIVETWQEMAVAATRHAAAEAALNGLGHFPEQEALAVLTFS